MESFPNIKALEDSGSPFASIYINASPITVMSILTNLKLYNDWCPFTTKMEGECKIGTTIIEHVQLDPLNSSRRLQHVIVTAADKERLHWYSKMGGSRFILFAQRVQFVIPEGTGTHYITCDQMSGMLSPLVLYLYGRIIREGFESIAIALKKTSRRD
jgi:hypothetical protein